MENKVKPKVKAASNPLVGKFFHSIDAKGYVMWQGRVVGNPEPGWYLLQLFEWLLGQESNMQLLEIAEMKGWLFYADAEDMRYSWEHGSAYQKRSPECRGGSTCSEEEEKAIREALQPSQPT